MKTEENQQSKPALFKLFVLAEVILLLIIAAIWWFLGEHSIRRFTDISFLVGVGAMLFGLILYSGTRGSTGSFGYQFAQTVNDDDMHKRISRDWKERFYTEWLIVLFIGVGVFPFIIGILADKILG